MCGWQADASYWFDFIVKWDFTQLILLASFCTRCFFMERQKETIYGIKVNRALQKTEVKYWYMDVDWCQSHQWVDIQGENSPSKRDRNCICRVSKESWLLTLFTGVTLIALNLFLSEALSSAAKMKNQIFLCGSCNQK